MVNKLGVGAFVVIGELGLSAYPEPAGDVLDLDPAGFLGIEAVGDPVLLSNPGK
ncbi:hypothetical protein [Arthrobacter sp. AQ5-05]|uniref:hypothetical protein n=1 Tax=Arthrobacter sp. AQ5-05 TaxID=2184581 RepID=UPI0015EBB31A|nr:hypothetical protein [Arthrobacter sp. AQ5-05]